MTLMKRTGLVGVIIFAAITAQTLRVTAEANPECAELEKKVEAIYADPRAEQCDGNLDGACGEFWSQLDSIYDRMDELSCPVDESDDGNSDGE